MLIIDMENANLSESREWIEGCIDNLSSHALLEELRMKFKYDREEYPRLPEYERLSDFLSGLRSRGALRPISDAIHLTLWDDGEENEVHGADVDRDEETGNGKVGSRQ